MKRLGVACLWLVGCAISTSRMPQSGPPCATLTYNFIQRWETRHLRDEQLTLLRQWVEKTPVDQRDGVIQALIRLRPEQWDSLIAAQKQTDWKSEDWAYAFGLSPFGLAPFETVNDWVQWVQLLLEPTEESTQWALEGSRRWGRSHPEFAKFLTRRHRQAEVDVSWMKRDGIVSVLWMSNTTRDRDAFTSMKIVVDGRVWSTVSSYEPEASLNSFSRLSRRSDGSPFLRIDLRTQPGDLEQLRLILKEDRRPSWIIPSCVGSACSALRESKVIDVPPPFDLSPMMTAVYLVVTKHFGNKQVLRVQWHTTPGQPKILNASVYAEAGLIATISAGALGLAAGALYLKTQSQP